MQSLSIFNIYLLKALLATIIVEELVLLILKEKKIKIYLICLIMNVITNVSLNILIHFVSNYYLFLIVAEVVIFIIEAFVYYLVKKDIRKAILISLICNILSFIIGMFI